MGAESNRVKAPEMGVRLVCVWPFHAALTLESKKFIISLKKKLNKSKRYLDRVITYLKNQLSFKFPPLNLHFQILWHLQYLLWRLQLEELILPTHSLNTCFVHLTYQALYTPGLSWADLDTDILDVRGSEGSGMGWLNQLGYRRSSL